MAELLWYGFYQTLLAAHALEPGRSRFHSPKEESRQEADQECPKNEVCASHVWWHYTSFSPKIAIQNQHFLGDLRTASALGLICCASVDPRPSSRSLDLDHFRLHISRPFGLQQISACLFSLDVVHVMHTVFLLPNTLSGVSVLAGV